MERMVQGSAPTPEGRLEAMAKASSKLVRAGIDMQRKEYQAIRTELLDSQHCLVTLRHRLPPSLKPLARQEILHSRGPSWVKVRSIDNSCAFGTKSLRKQRKNLHWNSLCRACYNAAEEHTHSPKYDTSNGYSFCCNLHINTRGPTLLVSGLGVLL
jgi:hypothetical protein